MIDYERDSHVLAMSKYSDGALSYIHMVLEKRIKNLKKQYDGLDNKKGLYEEVDASIMMSIIGAEYVIGLIEQAKPWLFEEVES